MGSLCTSSEDQKEVKVYGDYFNADTRSILNILEISGVKPKLIAVDTVKDKNGNISSARAAYAKEKNVADALPMVVHGGFKIMSDMEHILKYFEGTFSEVKSKMFEHIAEG